MLKKLLLFSRRRAGRRAYLKQRFFFTPVIEMQIFKYRIWNFGKNWLQNPYTKPKNSLRAALRGCKSQNISIKYTLLKKSSLQIRSSFDWDYASFARCVAFKIWKYKQTWGDHDMPKIDLKNKNAIDLKNENF